MIFKKHHNRISGFILLIAGLLLNIAADGGNIADNKETNDNKKGITKNRKPGYTAKNNYEYIPNFSNALIKDRLSCIETDMDLPFNDIVRDFIDYFTLKNRDYTRMILSRVHLYFPTFEEEMAKHDIPEALKYLAIVESGLNPRAKSPAGALGLWQFMPATGRYLNLNYNHYIDDRMNPEASTKAACIYLKQLYSMFNDWELALAAYNCGPGNVRRAVRRSGYKDNFWDVYRYLPRETRSYVPQFIALAYVLHYHEEHNLHPEKLQYPIQHDTIKVQGYVNLQKMAEEMNICLKDLQQLNPSLKRNAIPDNGKGHVVKIPADKKSYLTANRKLVMDSASIRAKNHSVLSKSQTPGNTKGKKKLVYRVRPGDAISTIADRYNVRVSDIRSWNNLKSNTIRIGQRLAIWKSPAYFKSISQSNKQAGQPIPDDKQHRVQPGDTLWDISRKYKGISIEKLKKLNDIKGNELKPGQTLNLG